VPRFTGVCSTSKMDFVRVLGADHVIDYTRDDFAGGEQRYGGKENSADLAVLRRLLESGKVTPAVDRTYPLSEIPDAIRYLQEGNARGKIVVTV